MEPSDKKLILKVRQGDEKAFAELIRRHEYPMAALIRYSVINLQDAEDVMQETLLDAWTGISKLRDPENVRAWLVQVARNRCSDYFRSRQRREVPVESFELEERIDSHCHIQSRQQHLVDEVTGALEQVPDAEREVARLFYLDGFTITEIAERHRCPQGTVKRQLFTARDLLRQAFGIASPERTIQMNKHRVGSKSQPFPKLRPEIEITPLDIEPFTIDCREMRYWSIIPEIGQQSLTADYDARGDIKRVWDLQAVRQAHIQQAEGVEIELSEWWHEEGWRPLTRCFYGRVLEDKVQWLAALHKSNEGTDINTFMDENFAWAYPDDQRVLSDGDLFEVLPDGALRTTREHDDFTESGVGYFNVRIGSQSFNCLRIIGLEGPIGDEDTCVRQAFITNMGRMALVRHFAVPTAVLRCCGETANEEFTVTVDGHTFSHFRDTLTGIGCEIV